MKHPYHSSKLLLLMFIEKPGTGIFLMKESAKIHRDQKQRTTFTLAKRLHPEEEKMEDVPDSMLGAEKKKKLGDGLYMVIPPSSQETVKLSNKQK